MPTAYYPQLHKSRALCPPRPRAARSGPVIVVGACAMETANRLSGMLFFAQVQSQRLSRAGLGSRELTLSDLTERPDSAEIRFIQKENL
jgi:hypothetical protein